MAVIFDIRRYERNAMLFAELAAEQGAEVVLVTTAGCRPPPPMRAKRGSVMSRCRQPGDSTSTILVVIEALLAQVQGRLATRCRAG
ncbi:MAG: hypothetical protein IPL38_09260 [Rhodobacter sp.]|nr:hypothetical protein [Rhodobacter sp.]